MFDDVIPDPRVRSYVAPTRIVWQANSDSGPAHSERLLAGVCARTIMWGKPGCVMGTGFGVLLDFGRELHGGIQIAGGETTDNRPVTLRVRFGESISEAMGYPNQDHAIQDTRVLVPLHGTCEVGNTGFRFVRADVVDEGVQLELRYVWAVFLYRDLEYKGAFECSDERLNTIWQTGAYTVHLNMQDQLWDGIKRDRHVWMGDMHPEAMVIKAVFGEVDVVPESLDLTRDETPLPGFMNNHGSYSLWWIIVHRDWYRYHGNLDYLKQQQDYLVGLLEHLRQHIGNDNGEALPNGFLDWPTSPDKVAVHAGLQALMVRTFTAGAELCQALNLFDMKQKCLDTAARLRRHRVEHRRKKSAAAMMVLAGMLDAGQTNNEILGKNPLDGLSTFYGYYILQARAAAGDYQGCLDAIRQYWGAMLDLGATTFWEDFDLAWTENAAPIDALVPEGKKDIHADCGDFCYKGLRHSLCHGWAGGPTAWLTEHILGCRPLEPGCRKLLVAPHLGDLDWAKGAFPTSHGVVRVSHERTAEGAMRSKPEFSTRPL